jgi:hypothetical protein
MHDTHIRILTKRQTGCHVESDVTIKWDGITTEQLYKLAQIALIHNLQSKIHKKIIRDDLERIVVHAAASVHEPTYCLVEFAPGRATKEVKIDKQLEKLLANLTEDELKALFS